MELAQEFLEQGVLAQDEAGGEGGLLFPLLMIVALFALFYFMWIRPQRRRREDQMRLQSKLSVGDEVVTIGGLYGTVAELDEQSVILETSEGVYSRYARGAISQVTSSNSEESAEATTDEAETGTSGTDTVVEDSVTDRREGKD